MIERGAFPSAARVGHGSRRSALLGLLFCSACGLLAQSTPATDAPQTEAQPAAEATEPEPSTKPDCNRSLDTDLHGYPAGCDVPTLTPQHSSEFVALNGAGVLPVGARHRSALFGGALIGGSDSAFAGTRNSGTTFYGQNGYAALSFSRPRGYVVLQDSADFVYYTIGNGTRQYFDSAGITLGGAFSATWSWDANVTNAFGNDSLQVITPLNTVNQQNLSVPSPGTPAIAIHAGLVLDNDAAFSMTQSSSRRASWRFLVRNSYRNVFDQKAYDNTLHVRVARTVQLSPLASFGGFLETAHENGTVSCTTQTLGLSYEREIMRRSVLQISGGPAVGTKGCIVTVTGDFFAAFTSRLSTNTSVYASATRNLNDSLLRGATWEDTVQGGVSQRFGLETQVRVDTGYLRGTQPKASENFHGAFVIGSVQRSLPGGFSVAFSARHFVYSGPSISVPARTQIFGTLGWSNKRTSGKSDDEVAVR